MAGQVVYAEGNDLGIAALKVFGQSGGTAEFGRTNGREVRRVRVEYDPAVAGPFVKVDVAHCGLGFKVGGGFA